MTAVLINNSIGLVRVVFTPKPNSWRKACLQAKNAWLTKTGPLTTSSNAVAGNNTRHTPKPFSELPTPKGLPIIGTLYQMPRQGNKLNDFLKERCKNYFPIYKESVGVLQLVVVYDINEIEKLFRYEAKYPRRFDILLWHNYRKMSGEADGLLTSNGEDWHKMRTVIDKPMLRIKDVAGYAEDVNEVITDFLLRLEKIRKPDGLVPDLEKELFNWSLETICYILYEKRFGGLSDTPSLETQDFLRSVRAVLESTATLLAYPVWFSRTFLRKTYRTHNAGWDTIFTVAKKYVDEKMNELAERKGKEEEEGQQSGVLSYLLKQNSLTVREIYANVSELMGGAVDTTSTAVLWMLQELSLHPEVQGKLLEEIQSVLPGGDLPAYKDLQQMPYLKAVVKETLRKYPVASFLNRVLQEEREICGYIVPAKTVVMTYSHILCGLQQYFEDPDEFRPERWLRDRSERVNPFLKMAFGFGTRMCVGRRVAELEINLFLARLIQKFFVEPGFSEPAKISVEMTIKPDRPMKIKLIERQPK